MPDATKFMQKLLQVERLEDAIEELEDYATAHFDTVHGPTMLTLKAEIEDLEPQIRRSAEIIKALDKQKASTPRRIKKSTWCDEGG